MAKLILKLDGGIVKEHELETDTLIGRESADIVLKNPAVSAKHTKISSDGDRFTLQDLNSTNGTFVNRERVASHDLRHGDVINIGKFELEFIDPGSRQMSDNLLGDDAAGMTVMINAEELMKAQDAKGGDKKAKKQAAKLILAQSSSGGGSSAAIVTYKLEKETTLMGTGDVDIPLKGLTIANVAAAIQRSSDGYHIKFMGGLSKLRVNGKKVPKKVELKAKDTIEIGSYSFEFHS